MVAELEERALRALARLHAAHPRCSAIPRARLAAALGDLGNDALVFSLLDRLIARGQVVGSARAVSLKGYEPKLSQAERKLKKEIAEAIRAGGVSPPDLADLAALAGQRAAVVGELLVLLCDEERLVAINSSLYLDADVELELKRRVCERLQGGVTITMSELRDLLATTRKYAVPIGEYLDRIGLTQREGDVRRLSAVAAADGAAALAETVPAEEPH